MPTLQFTGKSAVQTHHLTVPFHQPIAVRKYPKADGLDAAMSLDGNLLIQGDNLKALKALLPRYAGKIDVVCIDPPYNTGNEGWIYNDNVNSPAIRDWFAKETEITVDDLERHDKWLCMMMPRLQLIKELMSERASLWIFCDDNEHANLTVLLGEMFGTEGHVATFAWEKSDSPKMDTRFESSRHDYLICFAKNIGEVYFKRLPTAEDDVPDHYESITEDDVPYYLKPLRAMGGQGDTREARPNLYYAIEAPDGQPVFPKKKDGSDGAWRWSKTKLKREMKRIEWRGSADTQWTPYFQILWDAEKGRPPETIWPHNEVGSNRTASLEQKKIFPEGAKFDTPKPVGVIRRVLQIAAPKDAVVLDSFAGTGTTGHAVLDLNKEDGGERSFILVERDPTIATEVTDKRLSRVVSGLDEQSDGMFSGYDAEYSFVKLGEPMGLEAFFSTDMPDYPSVAAYVAYTAVGESLASPPKIMAEDGYIGTVKNRRVHLLYKPDLDFMQGQGAVLTPELAANIRDANAGSPTPAIVFGAMKWMSQTELSSKYRIEFCQIPYAVYRVFGESAHT